MHLSSRSLLHSKINKKSLILQNLQKKLQHKSKEKDYN